MAGPVDLAAMPRTSRMLKGLRTIFGAADFTDPVVRKASPTAYVTPKAPPFLIFHGEKDTDIPPSQPAELLEKFQAAGGTAKLVTVGNAGHWFKPKRPEITQEAMDFLVRILSP